MRPNTKLVTGPTIPAELLTSVKSYLRITSASEDALLGVLQKAAIKLVEKEINRKLFNQTWVTYFDNFLGAAKNDWFDGTREGSVSEMFNCREWFELPFYNASSISSFKTYDDDDTDYTFSSASYFLDDARRSARVVLRSGSTWPTTVLRPANGIEITAVFGYGTDLTDIPEDIQAAHLMITAYMYEHRGDEVTEIPGTALALLEEYRNYRVK